MNDLINYFMAEAKKDEKVELKDVVGKNSLTNGSKGLWAVNEPTDDDVLDDVSDEELSVNEEELIARFTTEKDFFIIGEAGWGKTSLIENMAKKFKRYVITVYLDKAESTDLGGIPVASKGKTGAFQEIAMPAWAKIIEDNPDKEFLLFFDEMNQGEPAVMNALMPIVLKHEICGKPFKNFFVGAAGNFEYENDSVSELSKPLKSRFAPIITWESGTDEAWRSAFKFLKKKWAGKIPNDVIEKFEENANLFENPREIDQKIFDTFLKLKEKNTYKHWTAEKFFRMFLRPLAKEDLTRSKEDVLKKLADAVFDFFIGKNDATSNSGGRSAKKDVNMIDKDLVEVIKKGIRVGYIIQSEDGKYVKYGVSRENIHSIDIPDVNAEMLDRLITKLEADGVKFKFEKDEEWKNKGYKDPNED